MANEPSLDHQQVTVNYKLEDYVRVMRLYGGPKQSVTTAFTKAINKLLEEFLKEELTEADNKAIKRLKNANFAKRYHKRVTDARYRGEAYVDVLDQDGRSGKRGRKPEILGRSKTKRR